MKYTLPILVMAALLLVGCTAGDLDSAYNGPADNGDDDIPDDNGDGGLDPFPGTPDECTPLYPDVRVVAHRGHTQYAPENTLPAYEYAYGLGCTAVEMDIRHTADGRYVMIHDDTVDRTTNGTGYVDEMTLAEIRALDIDMGWRYGGRWPGLKVPTFEEALELTREYGGELYLDSKTNEVEGAAQIILEQDMLDSVFIYSSNADKLERFRDVDPGFRIQPFTEDVQQTLELIERFDPDPELFEMDSMLFDAALIEVIHEHDALAHLDLLGVRDVLWVLGYEPAWLEPLQMGVDQLQTDHPEELLEYLSTLCE